MNPNAPNPLDPFQAARLSSGVHRCPFQGENIPMLLRHQAVRSAARDWQTFSSDAPFRVPIPSEESVRSVRQLPLETDPPTHSAFRKIVEPLFQRPKDPDYIAKIERLTSAAIEAALLGGAFEAVQGFAVPLQSRALTVLLNTPAHHAERWIQWGVHVFRKEHGLEKSSALDDYINEQIDRALEDPGDDFFSHLARAEFSGRRLTREEISGYANIAFAGGRDTIIHSVTCALGYLAEDSARLRFIAEDPKRVIHAAEEMFRVFMPLTHIGRVATRAVEMDDFPTPAGSRVALCWASANMDETVFDQPHEIRLDRKPNPHLSFGFGEHLCLGAHHARLLLRTLLRLCAERLESIECLEARPRIEKEETFERQLGYDSLTLRFVPLKRA